MTIDCVERENEFLFAQQLRSRIDELRLYAEWLVSQGDRSLTVRFVPITFAVEQKLGITVSAQLWVARPQRVSFEFAGQIRHSTQYEKLADDFRSFLRRRNKPNYCEFSRHKTVLRVPTRELATERLVKAVGLFLFVRDNIKEWTKARLDTLLTPDS